MTSLTDTTKTDLTSTGTFSSIFSSGGGRVGTCQNCHVQFKAGKTSKIAKFCPDCRKRSKYVLTKKDNPCKLCGKSVGGLGIAGPARKYCNDCRPKKLNLNCFCNLCNHHWVVQSTHRRHAPNVCPNCMGALKRGLPIDKKEIKRTKLEGKCDICKIRDKKNGRVCFHCKHLKNKIKFIIMGLTREDLLRFNSFMETIHSRGGLASKEEIFIDLLGWAGDFLTIDRYQGDVNRQIMRMWKDLNDVWVVIKKIL